MTDTTTGTEYRTYRGAAEAGAPRLHALPGVQREDGVPQEVLEVERYDTDDHRLAAAGITLAVHRAEGEQPHWRLDLPDADDAERLRVAIDPDGPPDVPGELAELVRGVARGGELRPAGRIRRVRTGTRLLGEDDRLLATLVHDHVAVATLGSSTEGVAWTEVQLHDAVDDGLAAELEQRLGEAGLRPTTTSAEAELDRLLRPPAPKRRLPSGKRVKPGTAGAALVDYLAEHIDRLAAEDLRARRGEHDSVHQLRVAARRLRSALQSYRRLVDRERTDPVVDALRELARELAPARDAEVLHERIREGLGGLEPELLLGPVQAQVTRHYARVEGEAAAAVLSALDGDAYARLRRDLDELLANPPLTKRAARPARKELPGHVARAARRLRSALQSYRRLLNRERTDPLIGELRELASALAPARDAEVLHARISDGLAELEPELLLGPVQAQVTRHYARVESEAAAAVLSTLDGEAYARLRRDLDDLVWRPPLTKRAARPAGTELPAHVGRAAQRLARAVEVAVDPKAPADERDIAVHDARKAGKRLRYATEVARPVVGSPAKRFAKELKGFQDALGEHQDTVVAREALRELAVEAHADGGNGFAFGVLHGRDDARAAQIEAELPDLWARAWRPRNRRWLS